MRFSRLGGAPAPPRAAGFAIPAAVVRRGHRDPVRAPRSAGGDRLEPGGRGRVPGLVPAQRQDPPAGVGRHFDADGPDARRDQGKAATRCGTRPRNEPRGCRRPSAPARPSGPGRDAGGAPPHRRPGGRSGRRRNRQGARTHRCRAAPAGGGKGEVEVGGGKAWGRFFGRAWRGWGGARGAGEEGVAGGGGEGRSAGADVPAADKMEGTSPFLMAVRASAMCSTPICESLMARVSRTVSSRIFLAAGVNGMCPLGGGPGAR